MSAIPGTNLAAPIAPFDTADTYPTHDEQFGKGGYRTVATFAARDAIPAARRKSGMRVKVMEADGVGIAGRVYELSGDLATWSGLRTDAEVLADLSARAKASPNILSDSYHEYTSALPTLGGWTWYDAGAPAFTTASALIPLKTPVAQRASGQVYRKQWDTSKLGLKAGDTITVSALAHFATAAGGRVEIYVRAATGTDYLLTAVGPLSGAAGLQVISHSAVIPDGHARLIVQVFGATSGGANAFEVAGVFASRGDVRPDLAPGPMPLAYALAWQNATDLDAKLAAKAPATLTTDLFEPTSNLFDKDSPNLVTGSYVRADNGQLAANAGYNAIHFIPIEPSTQYTFSRSGQIAWFSAAQAYLDGDAATADNLPKTLVSPATAAFVGVSVKPAWMADFRINVGDAVLPWEPAGKKFREELIAAPLASKADQSEVDALWGSVGKSAKPFAGLEYLKRARVKKRKRLRNQAAQLIVAAHMDSWGSTNDIGRWLVNDNLRLFNGGGLTALGLGGPGWIGLAFSGGTAGNGFVGTTHKYTALRNLYTVTRTGAWVDSFGGDIHSPDACSASTSDPTASYTITSIATGNIPTAQKLLVGGAGTLEYRFGGAGAYTAVLLSGAARQELALAGIPATAAWTLEIRNTSATPIKLMGLLPVTGDNGAIYHCINATGTRAQQRAALDPTSFAANAALLNPDIVLLGTPINDRNAGRTPAEWAADIATTIDLWRAFNPGIDIAIIVPPEVGGTNLTATPMSAYLAEALDLVDSKRVALLNFQPLCGAAVADYQYSHATNSLLDNLNTHLVGANNDGLYLYQEMLMQLIVG